MSRHWMMTDSTHRCDVSAVHLCPLYIESHRGRGLGCVDDLAQPCRVSRGDASYHALLSEVIRIAKPEAEEPAP